jgi:hypothetical protein
MIGHDVMLAIIIAGFAIQIAGLVILVLNLKESIRMTRAVAGLVYQEEEKTRALLRGVES